MRKKPRIEVLMISAVRPAAAPAERPVLRIGPGRSRSRLGATLHRCGRRSRVSTKPLDGVRDER
jgi:hypothetical protein